MRKLDAYGNQMSSSGASLYGTDAAKPAASTVEVGALYFASDTGGMYRSDGINWVQVGGGVIRYAKTTAKVVNTTVAATDLLNGEITLAANTLIAGKRLVADLFGDFLNTVAASPPPRIQVIVGGTTVLDTGAAGAVYFTTAGRFPWRLNIQAMALGAANSQLWWMQFFIHKDASGPSQTYWPTGTGLIAISQPATANSASGVNEGVGTSTVDMTASRTFVVNVINGNAGANYETRLLGALVDIS